VATRTVRARTLWIALAAVFVAGSAAIWLLLVRGDGGAIQTGTQLVGLSSDSTATVGYAGAIPSYEESSLPRPLGLDGDADSLYVALADAGTVGVFDYEGSFEATWPIAAVDGAPRSTPVDLTVLSDGRLAVVDTAGSRVVVIDPGDPNAQGEVFSGGDGEGRIVDPTAIDSSAGMIYVADAADGSVKEFAETGAFIRAMAFESPRPTFIGGLCVADRTLWVSDSNADRVLAVDLESGRQTSTLIEQLGLPRGVAVTGTGEIMIAETFGRRISVFDPEATTVVDEFPDTGTENVGERGLLQAPESVLWDEESSRLYVTDAIDGRVKVYNYRSGDS